MLLLSVLCVSVVSVGLRVLFLPCFECQKVKVEVFENSISHSLWLWSLTQTAADLGDGGGIEISFSLSLPIPHPLSLDWHYTTPSQSDAAVWFSQADFKIQRDMSNHRQMVFLVILTTFFDMEHKQFWRSWSFANM